MVGYPGRGAVPVFFIDGPPPGSLEYMARQSIEEQQRYAAWASSEQQPAAANAQAQVIQQLLQQF